MCVHIFSSCMYVFIDWIIWQLLLHIHIAIHSLPSPHVKSHKEKQQQLQESDNVTVFSAISIIINAQMQNSSTAHENFNSRQFFLLNLVDYVVNRNERFQQISIWNCYMSEKNRDTNAKKEKEFLGSLDKRIQLLNYILCEWSHTFTSFAPISLTIKYTRIFRHFS